MNLKDISKWGGVCTFHGRSEAPQGGGHARMLPSLLLVLMLSRAETLLAETPTPPAQAAPPVAVPFPQGVILYFPFLPVPGVPAQALPPPPPYFWPFPVLWIPRPVPMAPGPAAPMEAVSPPAAVAGPSGAADMPSETPAVASVAGSPAVAQPEMSGSSPAETQLSSGKEADPRTASEAGKPQSDPQAATPATPAKPDAGVKPRPAAKDVKKKARKLCWKDGRLDVCK